MGGWTVPSALPSSGFGGDSLFSRFINSIGNELAHFPSGPSLDSDFWIYLILYHIGLFLCILLGQIGVQGRKQVIINVIFISKIYSYYDYLGKIQLKQFKYLHNFLLEN